MERLKLLLVYPKIPTTYWSFKYALPFVGDRSLMPPLGLITVASMLPDYCDVTLIDVNVSQLSDEDILEADYVLISAMIVQKESFQEIISRCNNLEKQVIAGGPYATTSYEQIEGVSHFILNEAEITLPLFLEDLEAGNLKYLYEDKGKPDITKTPIPRFDLLDINAYSTMALQNSRGCPFNCEFCDIIEMFGRVPRYKTPEQFINEMDAILSQGYRGPLFIVDDNFIGNKKKVKELLKCIIDWQRKNDFPFALFTEASINVADDDELLELMRLSNIDMIFIGLETPDDSILSETNKNQNVKADLHESVKKIQRKGIEVLAGFILGFDNEPEDIFDRQIAFIEKAGIPMAMIGLMMALPETQLYRRLEREGRIINDSKGNNTHELELNFIPTTPLEILVDGYKKVISELYSPQKYFDRCLNMLQEFPEKREIPNSPITLSAIRALMLSLFKQGFSSYGFTYIKYVVKVFSSHRDYLAHAMSLAIKGYHLFAITKEILLINSFNEEVICLKDDMIERLEKIFESNAENKDIELDNVGSHFMKKLNKLYSSSDKKMKHILNEYHLNHRDEFQSLIDSKVDITVEAIF